jgi:hypothetical protein
MAAIQFPICYRFLSLRATARHRGVRGLYSGIITKSISLSPLSKRKVDRSCRQSYSRDFFFLLLHVLGNVVGIGRASLASVGGELCGPTIRLATNPNTDRHARVIGRHGTATATATASKRAPPCRSRLRCDDAASNWYESILGHQAGRNML